MDIAAKEDNILQWKLIIRPLMPPFNKGSFKIELNFPTEYPFKPPILIFVTPIYHPNVDEKGQVCLPIINAANWKPATKTEQGRLKFCSLVCTAQRLDHGAQKGRHVPYCAAFKTNQNFLKNYTNY